MKKILFFVMLLLGVKEVSGQINQEHTFDQYVALPVRVSETEVKIPVVQNGTLYIYNTDYSLDKTVNLNLPAGATSVSVTYLSKDLFNLDEAYEFTLSYIVNSSAVCVVLSESGSTLFTCPSGYFISIANMGGGTYKLVASSSTDKKSIYYTLPGKLYTMAIKTINKGPQPIIDVYPNPSADVMHITPGLSSQGHTAAKLSIVNLNGTILKTIDFNTLQSEISFPVNDLKNGVYLFNASSGSEYKIGSFVVQHR